MRVIVHAGELAVRAGILPPTAYELAAFGPFDDPDGSSVPEMLKKSLNCRTALLHFLGDTPNSVYLYIKEVKKHSSTLKGKNIVWPIFEFHPNNLIQQQLNDKIRADILLTLPVPGIKVSYSEVSSIKSWNR